MVDDKTIIRETHAALHEVLRTADAIASNVAHLARTLEQDDRLRERADRAEGAERDQRHETIERSLKALHERVDKLYTLVEKLPITTRDTVEAKIYELRRTRWETQQPLPSSEPMPLPPAGYRESSEQHVALARTDIEEHTKPFARHHVDGEKRTIDEWIGGAVLWGLKKGWPWAATALGSGGLVELLHKFKVW